MTQNIQFKVEKGRVLVPVGQACRFACKYCYTRSGEVGPSKIPAEFILQQFEFYARTHEFDIIQFGYDGDPFDQPDRGIMMLQRLASMGKHITYSTKAALDTSILEALAALKDNLARSGNILISFISLSCWESAAFIEPHTPGPQERIQNIRHLKRQGIPTFIALRPILPNVSDDEYERLVDAGLAAECDGFVLGPLYADEKGRFVRFIPSEVLRATPHEKVTVSWSAHAPVWTRYENRDRLWDLTQMIQGKKGRVFTSSVDAVTFAICQQGVSADDRSRIEV